MTLLTLNAGHFTIEVFGKENIIEITDQDGVCKVNGDKLIIPEKYYDIIAPYNNYRIEYNKEIYGYIRYTVLENNFYTLIIGNDTAEIEMNTEGENTQLSSEP